MKKVICLSIITLVGLVGNPDGAFGETFYATDDTCVYQELPTTSYCSSETAYAGAQGDNEWAAYFKWNLSSLQNCTILSATARFYCSEYLGNLMTPEVYEVTSSWSESPCPTWYTKPGKGGPDIGHDDLDSPGWFEVDGSGLVSIVQGWVDSPSTNHGLVICHDAYGDVRVAGFRTKEYSGGAYTAELIVTCEPQPEVELTLEGVYSGATPQTLFVPGDMVTVKLQAHNTGAAVSAVTTLNVFDSSWEYPNTEPSKIYDSHTEGEDETSYLDRDDTDTYTFTFQIPPDAPPGEYRIAGAIRRQPWEEVLDTTGPSVAEEDWSEAAYIIAFDVRVFGTTIITHGYQFTGSLPNWPITMAQAIRDRAGAGRVRLYNKDTGEFELQSPSDDHGETILVFDWAAESNQDYHGHSEAAGDALFAALIMGKQSADFSLDHLHFIGHSRGCVVNSEVAERLIAAGYSVEQVTTLDPVDGGWSEICDDYDVNPSLGNVGFVSWLGIDWADNYWSDDGGLDGRELPGTYPTYLGNIISHSEVHEWYLGTIDLVSGEDEWYGGTFPTREEGGYNQSRIVGGDRGSMSGDQTQIAFS
ncbi:MAG: DNRLRE domain-containing protein, partial [Desulfobacteraceae bacterium]|nr:DNRLRE domain-containing protein [Desulfobacteraceae bacterium]